MTRDSSSGRLRWKDWADSTVKPAAPFLRYCLCLATPTFGPGILQPTPLTPSTPRRWIKPVVNADRPKPQRNEEAQRGILHREIREVRETGSDATGRNVECGDLSPLYRGDSSPPNIVKRTSRREGRVTSHAARKA